MIMFPLLFGLDDLLAAGIVTALGSVVSSLFTNVQNSQINKDSQNWQEQMMDKQNEYNDPSNQVDRLQKAGINPIAGTMSSGLSVSGNTSAQHGTPSMIPMQDLMTALSGNSSLLGSAFKSSQEGKSELTYRQARLEQIQNQNAQLVASAKQLNASADAQLIANKYADMRELWALRESKSRVQLNYSTIAANRQTMRESAQRIRNMLKEADLLDTQIDLNYLSMDEVLAHIDESRARTENFKKDTELKDAQIGLVESENLEKKLSNNRYDELTDRVIAEYDQTIRKISADADLTEQEAYWYYFDEMDKNSLSVFGNKIPYSRFGVRHVKNAFDKASKNVAFKYE